MYERLESVLLNYLTINRMPYRTIIFKTPLYGIKNNYCRFNNKEFIINVTRYNNGNIGKIMDEKEIITKLPKEFNKSEIMEMMNFD